MNVSKYLQNLKFDPKLRNSIFSRYITNYRIFTLLLISLLAFGMTSYFAIPRKLNPTINIPLVIVSTVLPGGSPDDIESLITIPVEDSINTLEDVKQTTSSSRDSVSVVTIEFESGTDAEKAEADVKSAVDNINDLPEDALDPNVTKLDFENQPIWTFNLASEKNDRASLIRFARNLKTELEELTEIDNVQITGIDEQEIQIILSPESISSFGINPFTLTSILRNSLSSFPAGFVTTKNSSFSLTIDKSTTTTEDIRNLKISSNGRVFSLSDIAEIKEISKPEQSKSYILNGEQINTSVSFNVFRNNAVNIELATQKAEELVNEKMESEGHNFYIKTVQNSAEFLSDEFDTLFRDVTLTVILVFLVLLIFLGIRQALISMLAVPFTFLITFIVMRTANIEFSFLATFSLLLSLGLLVDDTIVVISAMSSYYRTGKFTPLETALLVFRDFKIVILTTTITTVWAFIPLLLSSGIIGEFIKPIPIVVSATLLGSLFVALFLTIPLMVFLLRPSLPLRVKILLTILLLATLVVSIFFILLPQSNIVLIEIIAFSLFIFIVLKVWDLLIPRVRKSIYYRRYTKGDYREKITEGFLNFRNIENRYHNILIKILSSRSNRRNAVTFVVIFSVFSFLLVPFGLVKNEFFPKTDEDNLYISIDYPTGTNSEMVEIESLKFLESLKNTEDIDFITLETGRSFSAEMGPGGAGGNSALFSITLLENRKKPAFDIAQSIRNDYANHDNGKVSVNEVTGGPPAGADLQIKLFGSDLSVLDTYATRIEGFLEKEEGVTNIDRSIKPGTSKLVFIPDQTELARNGMTVDQLGGWLRIFASGLEVDSLQIPTETDLTQDITFRLSSNTQGIEDISRIRIPTPTGAVLLSSLGDLQLKPNPTLITREDGRRTLSVTAGVIAGNNIQEKNAKLEEFANNLDLPEGYGWQTGGVNEENQESVNSILQAMIVSFILIIGTMVLQFSSFRKALIVMLVIPLSITGVFIIFALTNTPLSFPALIGVLALFGIVTKNSILVVDKIKANQESGMKFTDSIVEASTSRLEPIALTSIATIVGLIPITLSDPLWRGLGGSIIAGLTFSGTIMLFFIPVVYYMIYSRYYKGETKRYE